MMLKKRSLMFKLMTFINLSALVILVAIGSYNLKRATTEVESQIDDAADVLLESIRFTTADYVKENNSKSLQTIAHNVVKDHTINEIYFYDKNKKIIASAKNTNPEAKTDKYYEKKVEVLKLGEESNGAVGHIYLKYNHNEIHAITEDFIISGIIGNIVAQIILAFVVWFTLSKSIKALNLTTDKLNSISKATKESSTEVESIAHEVSSSANEQAASIQETVATLDEITSQVNTTVESVENSTKKSEESLQIATEGKNVVTEMIHSMEDIGKSNNDIMEEIARGNERIGGIVKIINEISQKTAVINDIVFQTKLLSFNASVEAARAGEHGKGFAVVAEEVGNLAQMSGKASKEIADILSDSVVKVNTVIEETNRNVKALTDTGAQKVDSGMKVAERCGVVLEDIVVNAAVVKNMLNEISVASKEQAEGVRNIAAAMNQLDQATLSNNRAAAQSSENAKKLSLHSTSLETAVEELHVEIFGGQTYVASTQSTLKAEPIKTAPVVEKVALKHVDTPKPKVKAAPEKVAASNAITKKDNVLPMPKKAPVKAAKVVAETSSPKKKVSGSDVPTYDDPRFEDV